MKSKIIVEFQGIQTTIKDIEEKLKDSWKENGGKLKDIKNVDIYFKPEEKMCYYVVNESEKGSFSIDK